jgi:transketolase
MDYSSYRQIAKEIRKKILNAAAKSQCSHIGSALSCVEILTGLYFNAMRIDPSNPKDDNRDIFILSKGHGCLALYATLSQRGFFSDDRLDKFYIDGGELWGHSSLGTAPGIEATTGSLGHGLPISLGFAIASKHDKKDRKIFVVLSDGECDEGSTWEAAMYAGHKKLDNLVAIVDYNKIQSLGNVKEVLNLEPFSEKWKSFGWSVIEIDGHDMKRIIETLKKTPFEPDKPSVIIAHTIKGKGVSFMENQLAWHYKSLNEEQLKIAQKELESR